MDGMHEADGLEWHYVCRPLANGVGRTAAAHSARRVFKAIRSGFEITSAEFTSARLTVHVSRRALFEAELPGPGNLKDAEPNGNQLGLALLRGARIVADMASIWFGVALLNYWPGEDGSPGSIGRRFFFYHVLLSRCPEGEWLIQKMFRIGSCNVTRAGRRAGPARRGLPISPRHGYDAQPGLSSSHDPNWRRTKRRVAIRLSPIGRWLLGLGPMPHQPTPRRADLLFSPTWNSRLSTSLTPALIAGLSHFAPGRAWGPACLHAASTRDGVPCPGSGL